MAEEPAQSAMGSDEPAQPSLRRMRRFGVRPDRDLGQNFLIDSNILGVIGRAAELHADDVVLEVGGGLGVLSEYLAQRSAHVHVVEIDERLRDALGDATDAHANVTVHWADAMALDLAALEPAPIKVVANLPYGVAAGVLLRTVEELPEVRTWVAMVQREVGERLAARPGVSAYGVPSVLAQLACDVTVLRAIPRTVFHPVPNVDSVLVGMRRREAAGLGSEETAGGAAAPGDGARAPGEGARAPGEGARAPGEGATGPGEGATPELRALVAAAFAHRRKTLVGSLALAGDSRSLPRRSREQVREALTRLGHPADVRAERLSPEEFRALAGALEL
ncbi:MAG TPA: 16S rRNA (adenine(1518)-N(6)/adenine(1519)-N(6))-dimethyltransferase RsmA [Solirubrobacteraceae bacterium]|nr:16S rRNA (adenine(1518)-N(6)/adenine(1519)-N(6))-dimethyltransferase RsmA [Solirubrobacteraceae bacterium]